MADRIDFFSLPSINYRHTFPGAMCVWAYMCVCDVDERMSSSSTSSSRDVPLVALPNVTQLKITPLINSCQAAATKL